MSNFIDENYFVEYEGTVGRVIDSTFNTEGSSYFLVVRSDGSHISVRSVLAKRVPNPQSRTYCEMYW